MSLSAPLFKAAGSGLVLRPYQDAAVRELRNFLFTESGNPLVVLPTGCHARGTLLRMAGGALKAVEAITVGDMLAGPDGRPRRVLQLARGREAMRRVVPVNGAPFVVNASHILPLWDMRDGSRRDMTAEEFRTMPDLKKWMYRIRNVVRGELVEFTIQKMPVDDFFGFRLDGDHLYVDDQGFVHHNTGKSLVIADFCKGMLTDFPGCRIAVMTNSQELVGQNAEEMLGIWPQAPLGIHNAGLNRWDTREPLIFGSIQSMHKKAFKFQNGGGIFDIILVDEAQNIPRKANTMWMKFINDLKSINQYLRVAGLTATPFRMDSGRLDTGPDAMFDKVVYEYPIIEAIEEGYLTQPISDDRVAQINTDGIGVRAGEFIADDLEQVAADPAVVDAVVREMIKRGKDRKGWIVFGTGVKHCMMMRECFLDNGISCEGVFAKEPDNYSGKYDRKSFVERFKAKEIRCLVSMNALTVGFNSKHADLLGFARPTKSLGLWIQGVGRVTRPLYAPGFDLSTREGRLLGIANGPKPNSLVLDFGGNTQRHGLIDRPNIKTPNKGDGTMPVKHCPKCGTENMIAARACKACGEPFPVEGAKVTIQAAAAPLLSTQLVQPKVVDVHDVSYSIYAKAGKIPTLRVDYHCGMLKHSEWICFDHEGYAKRMAIDWWHKRATTSADLPAPQSVQEAFDRCGEMRHPKQIRIKADGPDLKYTKILGHFF